MKYSGCVNLKYEAEPDYPMPGMKASLAYIRGLLLAN
jgi:hypothetical protein